MEQITNGISYQYQVLRYRHDIVSGEFANIGIVYFDPSTKVLKTEFIKKYGRLSQFFGDISSTFLMRTLKFLKAEFRRKSKELLQDDSSFSFNNVSELTSSVLPKDDNALVFSEVFSGWHFKHDIAFKEIYSRIIEQYQEEPNNRKDDSYAWKEVYKKYFDQYGITPKLKPKDIPTANTAISFDKTVQNGALHCFQSLSFDLKNNSTIEEKIFKWDGRIRELATANQPLKVYLLSVMPQDDHLIRMIEQKLNFRKDNIEVRVVDEHEASTIASEVNRALEAHV